nr:RNA-binding cell elongation regulator Jag/EloR [uncultured Acetatifactor sp.]
METEKGCQEYVEVSAKTVGEAITEACRKFGVTSDKLDYQIVEEGSSGFLGIGSKPAVIKAAVKVEKLSVDEIAKGFLRDVFGAMNMEVAVDVQYDEEAGTMSIDLAGDEMGILIGKRGQTLDSLQYLVSLVVNKESDEYIRVKVDTEDYRARRKETLENLAKNIAYKVKKTRRAVSLEPMNPYERRIIHSALQNDKYIATHSEGDEPFRRVVVTYRRQ